jgi:small subunit ribosomal protein S6
MERYETLFIQHPELPEAQLRETNDRVRRLIESMSGQVLEFQEWGMRDLAYPIRKHSRGVYALVKYEARPEVLKELERTMRISDEVLRFVSVRQAETKPRNVRKPRTVRPASDQDGIAVPGQGS